MSARAVSGVSRRPFPARKSRYQIGNDALIDIEVTFVFTQIPNLVALVQHTPDLRTEAECMRKHLKYDVALMWPKSFAPKSCQGECMRGVVGEGETALERIRCIDLILESREP